MAEIAEGGGGGHGKSGKKRAKKQSTRIDMTPMVDLAFLLLTFFVMTSTFSKPKSMEISFPAKPKEAQPDVEVKNGLTVILTKDDKVFYYKGQFNARDNKDGKVPTELTETQLNNEGLHKVLLELNDYAKTEIAKFEGKLKRKEIQDSTFKRMAMEAKGDKKSLTVLIKTDDKATYRNVIDIVDELNICYVGKYVIIDMSAPEYALLNEKIK